MTLRMQAPSKPATGVQHWRSTLAFNTGVQHWRSTLAFNTGVQHWRSTLAHSHGDKDNDHFPANPAYPRVERRKAAERRAELDIISSSNRPARTALVERPAE